MKWYILILILGSVSIAGVLKAAFEFNKDLGWLTAGLIAGFLCWNCINVAKRGDNGK